MSEKIRPYREADHGALVALWQACGLTTAWNHPESDIALAGASPNAEILVAADGPKVVASVMVGHDGHRGWLYYLAVEPERQRRCLDHRQ